jgi:hypothetical protein
LRAELFLPDQVQALFYDEFLKTGIFALLIIPKEYRDFVG